ncbi:hypothetical protein PS652_05340 [Pseudomonas fluorescens]|uniref:Uncharacterized protein n=1 Tax=Pseudomonas fluorescens TaxID=294 RepID=A0A5E6VRI4_PSEFL|nr:hypothetical protein PS652_04284 [Pseudomonas fluorescens]
MSGLREERCLGAVLAMKIARLFVHWEYKVFCRAPSLASQLPQCSAISCESWLASDEDGTARRFS